MTTDTSPQALRCIAFLGERCIATGDAKTVLDAVLAEVPADELPQVLLFDCNDSRPLELDLRLSPEAQLAQYSAVDTDTGVVADADADTTEAQPKKRGRPRLGVVSKEVTLLPRHWAWLAEQPGGASVALRRLVEDARKAGAEKGRVRRRQEACYRFMHAIAGNLPNFEEATRALYARESALFHAEIADWPRDIRAHAADLAAGAFVQGCR